jgi:hypothetical protein
MIPKAVAGYSPATALGIMRNILRVQAGVR